MEFTKTVYIGDVPFEVTFDAERSKPAVMNGQNMRPAEGGEAEISEAKIEGYDVFDLLGANVRDKLHEKVSELVAECLADADDTAQADAAEARYASSRFG